MNRVADGHHPPLELISGPPEAPKLLSVFKKDAVVVLSADACLDGNRLDVALLGEQLRHFRPGRAVRNR